MNSFSFQIAKLKRMAIPMIVVATVILSLLSYYYYSRNNLVLAYNDARSHLDISRRVVENLKPGFAQIGSVWLPLPHVLMIPTIWNDFMWHSGLSGSIISMFSYVVIAVLIYKYLSQLKVSWVAKMVSVGVFALNMNVLYMQSTSMTELLLLFTMIASSYFLLKWFRENKLVDFLASSFFLMLSTLVRYDGWFHLMLSVLLIGLFSLIKKGYKETEGKMILFSTLAGFGVFLWFLWNLAIFKDPLYFAFGPFSAHHQQDQWEALGDLLTKGDLLYSLKIYFLAVVYTSYIPVLIFALLGFVIFLKEKKYRIEEKVAAFSLLSPLFFNILALYLGHSVLFIQGVADKGWFNVRYGLMPIVALSIFIAFLVDKLDRLKLVVIHILAITILFSFLSFDSVTLEDAVYGSSGTDVSGISIWLKENANDKPGFILISAASHDAIVFSSGFKMSRFIHEGTGLYWESATSVPDKWARFIIMQGGENGDLVSKAMNKAPGFSKYNKVKSFSYADIYELDNQYVEGLNTEKIFY